ncbi:DUF397 domain-containing protein [Catenulispora yoronensis]
MTDGLQWRKAAASNGTGACVELASPEAGVILLRDSKDPQGAVLTFTRTEIAAFLDGAKAGEFDEFGH